MTNHFAGEYIKECITNGKKLTIIVRATKPSSEALARSFNTMCRIVKELES
jgi:hypothetical protein